MGPYAVQLRFSVAPATLVIPQYILTVEAVSAINMSKKVFVYRRTTLGNDVYEGIASPSQMLQIPEDAPDSETTFPNKFRKATAETSSEQADVVAGDKDEIERGVLRLTNSLQAAYDLSAVEIVYVGVLGAGHSTDSSIGET